MLSLLSSRSGLSVPAEWGTLAPLIDGPYVRAFPRRGFWRRAQDWVLRILPASRQEARVPGSAQLVRDLARFAVPKGVIVMWSGKVADIPATWALCDGTNGTPNLVGSFIKGGATAGATGGAATHGHDTHGTHTTHALSQVFESTGAAGAVSTPGNVHSAHSAHSTVDNEPPYYTLCFIMKL